MAGEDPCIGPSHISLFAAILYIFEKQECVSPVSVYSRDLMKLAKISACSTYHRCIKDLASAGCLRYIPSFNPVLGSLVFLEM